MTGIYSFAMNHQPSAISHQLFDWDRVDDVLLDVDGTLLDRHFDNFFFEEELPRCYAAKHGLMVEDARERLLTMYRAVEGELDWTDLNYWTKTLDIDVVALTKELDHLIALHPDSVDFLRHVRAQGKRIYLLTSAHAAGIEIKVAKTGIDRYVDRILNAFEVGYLKMRPEFWPTCQRLLGFEPSRSLYIDDDEACLAAAQKFGVKFLYHRSKSSSRQPPQPSSCYESIESFHELLAPGDRL